MHGRALQAVRWFDASTCRASRAGKNSTTCVPTPLFVWTVMSPVLLVLRIGGVNNDVRRSVEMMLGLEA
ncbi:hypothetical protein PISMIDRAFT_672892 [Pisolithus microcarpus 441]|uniref:Unplaced genomic scaffold scaffold_7, whole genome shotgun sequence n=1 Tax=Pisolithus microcarpus 441 TaxID=765257 RepID=A0A0D0A9Q5_9AGAM|nr:hypothetical protein BKA83DRAFT_672892 [Pisolithus microcarpus]KIK28718.1 hypothetical protein PISMIDRAFT_672892 [Pisolithus microcarpus 441]